MQRVANPYTANVVRRFESYRVRLYADNAPPAALPTWIGNKKRPPHPESDAGAFFALHSFSRPLGVAEPD